jgi:hypothetical protein
MTEAVSRSCFTDKLSLELQRGRERIARAAPAFGVLHENGVFDQSKNVAMRGVLRALGDPLRVMQWRALAIFGFDT